MAQGDAREGKWRGKWWMQWVASTLHTTSQHGVSSTTTADAHTSAASSGLNWRPRRFKWTRPFAERRNLVSARVPSRFKRTMQLVTISTRLSTRSFVRAFRTRHWTLIRSLRDPLLNFHSLKYISTFLPKTNYSTHFSVNLCTHVSSFLHPQHC